MRTPEKVANKVLDETPVVVPEDLWLLEEIVFTRGAYVIEEPLAGSEANIIMVRGGRSIITLSSTINNIPRKRFSLAHELGHLELHKMVMELNLCVKSDIEERYVSTQRDFEKEANQFASYFLLPERFVGSKFRGSKPSFEKILQTAEDFRVSATVASLRYLDFTEEPLAVVSSKSGRIRFFKASKAFIDTDLFVNVGEPLAKETMAYKLRNGLGRANGWRNSFASDWLRSGDYQRDAKIKEWSINMPSYDSVLTLLWIDEEIYSEDYFDLWP